MMACLLALVAHYGVGALFGMFPADIWTANAYWFAAAVIRGGPLGVVGSLARRADRLGMAARLLVPIAELAEPFVTGKLSNPAFLPWAHRVSDLVSGVVVVAGGVVNVVLMVAAAPRSTRAAR